jgi:magnesium chelatase family protein
MNPCPQGLDCDLKSNCHCTQEQQRRYRKRLSAPFLDRIDLQIEVPRLSHSDLSSLEATESSETVRARVCDARNRQQQRQQCPNYALGTQQLAKYCVLKPADDALLGQVLEAFKLSARACHRILKVARTIADLDQSENNETAHLTEAVSYRSMDRLLAAQ